jgi:hypothetical protein
MMYDQIQAVNSHFHLWKIRQNSSTLPHHESVVSVPVACYINWFLGQILLVNSEKIQQCLYLNKAEGWHKYREKWKYSVKEIMKMQLH